MARLFRAALSLLLLCGNAFAAVPTITQYAKSINGPWMDSFEAACSSYGGKATVKNGRCMRNSSEFDSVEYSIFTQAGVCPANSTKSGSSCTCNADYLEQGGQCVSKQDPNMKCAGDFVLSGFGVGSGKLIDTQIMKGEIPSGEMCWPHDTPGSGCTVNFVQDKVVGMPDGSKQTYGRIGMYSGAPGTTQGKACNIADPGQEVSAKCKTVGMIGNSSGGRSVCADPPECPGGFGGETTFNGITEQVCVKDDGANVVKSEKKTEIKKPDGSTEKVTEKTSCQGKTCTTEKTSTNTPAGGGSSTTNVTNVSQSKDDYCKNNADSAQCKGDGKGDGGGKFGGSCSGGFTCEGDALQCSMAQEQHKRACELMSNPSDESKLYEAEKGKTGNRTNDLPGNESIDLGAEGIDTSSAIGGGSCISDIQVSVMGQSATLPVSDLCRWLDYMGNILVAVAMLGALRIIAGS